MLVLKHLTGHFHKTNLASVTLAPAESKSRPGIEDSSSQEKHCLICVQNVSTRTNRFDVYQMKYALRWLGQEQGPARDWEGGASSFERFHKCVWLLQQS